MKKSSSQDSTDKGQASKASTKPGRSNAPTTGPINRSETKSSTAADKSSKATSSQARVSQASASQTKSAHTKSAQAKSTTNRPAKNKPEATTHFGYQEVPTDVKAARVADVFKSVANKYDLMNDVMSFGIHRLWKRYAIELTGLRSGHQVLDIAGGTGDLATRMLPLVGEAGQVILADINAAMLEQGRERLIDHGIIKNVEYVQTDAQSLPFADDHFNCITIAFGLRNVTDIPTALESMYRVLKPGGRLLVLEFSKPVLPGLKTLYDTYSFKILPAMGKIIADDADSYRYLAESIRMHPDQETLKERLQDAGFENCDYFNLSGGIVAVHRGFKL
ncbi:MAG: bifunctional demethylmenaquinone methyltransferase/2-methoxy-6-polyprenyl-1,4-benzoquinol methylase UbiE [Thiohalomonadales bacterium]